jgi:hypothetical protein
MGGEMTPPMLPITAADLRARLARERRPIYIVAARAKIHPVRLGRLLAGRLTLTPALAARITDAIDACCRERW